MEQDRREERELAPVDAYGLCPVCHGQIDVVREFTVMRRVGAEPSEQITMLRTECDHAEWRQDWRARLT